MRLSRRWSDLSRITSFTATAPQARSSQTRGLYQRRTKRAFDKRVRPRQFKEGNLVLKKIQSFQPDPRGKWTPNYEGPCVAGKAFFDGTTTPTTINGEEPARP